MMCGATSPTKLMMPTNDTATAASSEQMPMLASITARVLTPRLFAVSAPLSIAL